MLSNVGYQPTLSIEMGSLQGRINDPAIYVRADEFIDLDPTTTFAYLDSTTVLS
ncbi:hypothetical protein IC582_027720 [Cucumis melo]